MKASSLRIVALVAIFAPFLVFYPTITRTATVTVMVGNGGFFFKPSSVRINTGDSVLWMWNSTGHSSTSGCHIFCEPSKKSCNVCSTGNYQT